MITYKKCKLKECNKGKNGKPKKVHGTKSREYCCDYCRLKQWRKKDENS